MRVQIDLLFRTLYPSFWIEIVNKAYIETQIKKIETQINWQLYNCKRICKN